jgi:hypothetical protein
VTLHAKAYSIARKYQMLGDGMPDLFVDSAALWVERGDDASIVAARKLLRMFATATDSEAIIHALREVYSRDGVWVLDSVQPAPEWKRPASPLPAGNQPPPALPPGVAEEAAETD